MKKLKVAVIGAGSADFGGGMVVDLVSSEELRERDLEIVLVDIDREALDRMYKFSGLLKEHFKSKAQIKATTDRLEALEGASYVMTSVARKRYDFWQKDYFIPAAYGFKNVQGENGGPGGAFHTLRSLNLMIPICKDMEKLCPDALLLNFTNPESRVCMGVSKLTRIRSVGLCHGPMITLYGLGKILNMPEDEIELTVGGLNHFHWILKIVNKKNGEDLYPELEKNSAIFNWDQNKLTPALYKIFGLFPFPSPGHTAQFMNFSHDMANLPVEAGVGEVARRLNATAEENIYVLEGISNMPSYDLWSMGKVEKIKKVLNGEIPVSSEEVSKKSGELAVPIMCDIEFDLKKRELGGNVLNEGFVIENLPEDAIVEVPLIVSSEGVRPEKVGALPTAIAGMCSTQIYIQKLLVEAYEKKSRKALFQALLVDPVIDHIDRARKMMDVMLKVEEGYLPELQ